MNMFSITDPTTKSLGRPAKLKPKEEAVTPCWKVEPDLPINLKPPSLLKICNSMESTNNV